MAARLLHTLCVSLILASLDVGPASAQRLPLEAIEADISAREIAIESTFTGVRIVVFGTVTHSRQMPAAAPLYDIAVVIRGAAEPVVAWRKSRVAGIWINTDAETFEEVPGYYAALSTRPLEQIASREVLDAYGIGLHSLRIVPAEAEDEASPRDQDFRDAVIRIRQREGLYRADDFGVTFIGTRLFRATVDLPANVPVGEFVTDVFLFRGGELLNRYTTNLVIHKRGFEEIVTRMAFDYPLLYGIVAVLIAIAAGLLGSALFRRD